ncbi:hypothetical protein ACWIUD_04955 [Helicobacter sp. 23-1044]
MDCFDLALPNLAMTGFLGFLPTPLIPLRKGGGEKMQITPQGWRRNR